MFWEKLAPHWLMEILVTVCMWVYMLCVCILYCSGYMNDSSWELSVIWINRPVSYTGITTIIMAWSYIYYMSASIGDSRVAIYICLALELSENCSLWFLNHFLHECFEKLLLLLPDTALNGFYMPLEQWNKFYVSDTTKCKDCVFMCWIYIHLAGIV